MIALPFVAIDVLLVVLWAIAAALAIALIMRKLGSILSGVPWIGGKLSDAAEAMAQAITNACGTLMSGAESIVGAGLHWLARHVDRWLNQFVAHAAVIERLAAEVATGVYSVSGLRSLVRSISYVAHAALALANKLEREFKGIEAGVKALEREIATGIGHDLRIQIKALEREVTTVENKIIPAIRGEVATAEGEIGNLYDWIKGKADILGVGTFAFAIATIVGPDAFRLIRCDGLGNLARKYRCGLWDLLANLLPLAGFLTLAFDFQEFVDAAEIVAEGIGSAVASIEGTFALSLEPLPPPN